MNDLIERQTSLSGNIIMLCRFLRTKGYTITSSEEQDAMNALLQVPPVSEEWYLSTLRAVLSKNQFQYERFSDFYKEYRHQLQKAVDSKTKNLAAKEKETKKPHLPSLEALKDWLYHKPSTDEIELPTYSNIEVLVQKDFSMMRQDEIIFILRMLQMMTRRILRRKGKLEQISKSRKHLNIGMTLRKNLRRGTEINKVIFSERKIKKLKLVLICDVSRSMDLYSRFFVQMMYAFQSGYNRIETFVFSTALHRISEILNNHSFDQAFEIVSDRVPQWSGGTKIGACLDSFCTSYAHRMLDRKTLVLILSDGWDTGNPEVLKASMKKIYKSSRKVIWLNPLAGHPDFKPEVAGMIHIQPYIHQLCAAHNLESLRKVLHAL